MKGGMRDGRKKDRRGIRERRQDRRMEGGWRKGRRIEEREEGKR